MKHLDAYKKGLKAGLPIGLGYFAVSFSLGIVASNAGLKWFEGALASLLINASAGESAGFIGIKENITYIEMALVTLVANARYILMSCSMSQKFNPKTSIIHRILLGFFLTDEYFALAIEQEEIDPYITYGAITFATPMWAIGTALGILFGNILPSKIVSAFSVALYGMFLAIIVPQTKKDKTITYVILISFICSYIFSRVLKLSSTITIIILTVLISMIFAFIKPKESNDE